MPSSYTTSLKIQQMGNGEDSGTWGTITNTNWALIEQAVAGVDTITMANANYTLTNLNGISDEARNMVIVATGTTGGAGKQIIAPLVPKFYIIKNSTSDGYSVNIGASTGAVITIPNGVTAQVYCDGTNFYSAQTGSAGNFLINGNLTVTGNEVEVGNMSVGGTFSSTGAASLNGGGTSTTPTSGDNSTNIATTAFVNASIAANPAVITGSIQMWPTTSAPSGYLLCNGAAVSRTTYAALFSLFGTTFGSGDGSTTFNLPNYQDRMPIGVNSIAGSIGAIGGSSTTTISQANIPNYNLTVNDSGHSHTTTFHQTSKSNNATPYILSNPYIGENLNGSVDLPTSTATTGITVASGGSGTAMTTISPYLGINFIIKT